MGRKNRKEKAFGISISGPTALTPDSEFTSGPPLVSSGIGKPYKNHAYVYACIRAIAQNIAQVPFITQTGTGKNPKTLTNTDPPPLGDLVRVFETPNSLCNKYQLWEATITHMHLTGSAVWVMDRKNVSEIPKSIYVFGPGAVVPIMAISKNIVKVVAWAFVGDGTGDVIALSPAEVVFFKFYNPYDPVYGLAPLEAAARGIKFDYLASVYGSNFFENSADPSGVITTERKLTGAQVTQFRESWEQRHRGPGNAKKVGILWGGMQYQPIPVSQKDMEFVAQRNWTREELLAVFKVPKTELGLYEDVNHATSLSQDRSFWMKTLIPIITNLQAGVEAGIVTDLKKVYDPNLRCLFDTKKVPALQEQLSEKVANAEKLFRIGYPINAINEVLELGLPRVEWGDTWYVNQAIVPIDFVLDGRTTISPKPSGQTVPGEDGEPPGQDKPPKNDPDDPTDAQGEDDKFYMLPYKGARKSLVDNRPKIDAKKVIDSAVTEMAPLIKSFLWRLRQKQLASYVKSRTLFNTTDWNEKLSMRINPIILGAVRNLGVAISEVSKDNHPTISYMESGIAPLLSGDISLLRDFFNLVASDTHIEVLARKELLEAYKAANRKTNGQRNLQVN